MSDTVDPLETEARELEKNAKRGFSLSDRLRNRGLRKASVVLFLDEELGEELGNSAEATDQFGNGLGRWEEEGVLGSLAALQRLKDAMVAEHEQMSNEDEVLETKKRIPKLDTSKVDSQIGELEKKRDEMVVRLAKTGITVKMRAVPPIIQKDCRRKAKVQLGIESKNVPEALQESFSEALSAHLMDVILQSVTDNETGEVNHDVSYDDAIELMGYLPPSQWARLEEAISKVQYTDAISQSIETQEDFS